MIRVAILVHLSPPCTTYQLPQILELRPSRLVLDSDDLRRDFVLVDTCGVGRRERAEHVHRILFGSGDDGIFDVLMYWAEWKVVSLAGQWTHIGG
jgi:hypothetical protein